MYSGISTTSDSQSAIFAACVNSCSFSSQGFEDFSKLCRATEDHILKHTGLVVHIGDVVGLLSEHDLRHFPPALVKSTFSASCFGVLPDFMKSNADRQALAVLYCSGDSRRAAELVRSDPPSLPPLISSLDEPCSVVAPGPPSLQGTRRTPGRMAELARCRRAWGGRGGRVGPPGTRV